MKAEKPDVDEVSIRCAEEADVPLLLLLVRELAEYEKLAHEVRVDEELLRQGLFGPERSAEALVAHVGESPAGFAVFFSTFSTFLGRPGLYLEDLFVRPAFRGRGIGRGLLEQLAREAARRRCGRLEWTVLDWNARAIEFYERFGARVLPDWRVCRLTGDSLDNYGQ